MRQMGNRYLIPIAALASFQAKPHGRIRQHPVEWKRYATSTVYLRRIDAQILPGCETALVDHITAMADQQEHCFAGTMQRFVWISGGVLSIVLIWKSTEASPAALERDMVAFRAALTDLVEWERAHDETSEVIAHT